MLGGLRTRNGKGHGGLALDEAGACGFKGGVGGCDKRDPMLAQVLLQRGEVRSTVGSHDYFAVCLDGIRRKSVLKRRTKKL